MKVRIRDGFKFGFGCCLAYELYRHIVNKYEDCKTTTNVELNEKTDLDSTNESYNVKQKISFAIE